MSSEQHDTNWFPHVTVATVVKHDGRYLLVEEQVGGQPVFNQPAGHLDADETLLEAAVRETLEESGYRVAPEWLVGIYQWTQPHSKTHFVRATFAARLLHHEPAVELEEGIIAAHWLSLDEVEGLNGRLRSPVVLSNILDYERGHRYPLDLLRSIHP